MKTRILRNYEAWVAAIKRVYLNRQFSLDGDVRVGPVLVGAWSAKLRQGSILPVDVVARTLAKTLNHDHTMDRDTRYTVSTTLSSLLQRLGAQGVDAASETSAAQEGDQDES